MVDDEDVLRQMVARVLKYMGIESDSATDGFNALEKLKAKTFDIVIADIRMPNMDGMELLKVIRKEYPATDVMIMTAHSSKYSYVDVVETGAVDFITKPFSVEELKAKIERILRERQTLGELAKKTSQLEQAYMELLTLKDEEERICRDINYEKEFLLQEIDRLRDDNKRLSAVKQGNKK
ncbi:MAG: response regulator [Nitrospinae bacterium]|nr:response regulator [Nitrospinota bacterium]